MKYVTCLIVIVVVCLTASPVFAQTEADLLARIEGHYEAINTGDNQSTGSHHLPEFSLFNSDGGLLLESGYEAALERQGASLDFGTGDVHIDHFNAQIYGNVGVATFYLHGTHESDEGTTLGTWRVSAVWVFEDGEWQEAHHHESPLVAGSSGQGINQAIVVN